MQNQMHTLGGIDAYELILNGNYILHKADVMIGEERSETFEIISLYGTEHRAKMQYFNSKGESGIMIAEITGNDFRINGEGIRFIGTFSADDSEIHGKWFHQMEDKTWREFIKLKLDRQP